MEASPGEGRRTPSWSAVWREVRLSARITRSARILRSCECWRIVIAFQSTCKYFFFAAAPFPIRPEPTMGNLSQALAAAAVNMASSSANRPRSTKGARTPAAPDLGGLELDTRRQVRRQTAEKFKGRRTPLIVVDVAEDAAGLSEEMVKQAKPRLPPPSLACKRAGFGRALAGEAIFAAARLK